MRIIASALCVVALLGAADAAAFAFLCNGIDANGNVDGDGCGSCSANNAARWDELQVDFAFDDAVRPPEVTLAEWQANQTATIAGWMNVNGHSLTIRDGGAASFRQFGAQNGENSIFWITNRNEFNQQVGGGINSILGVTLAPYTCGNPRRGGIEDADIVMNGVGFDWDQNSVVSTLAHEMGHAIGFGHPCTDCSNVALMSATSGFDESDTPLLDDEDAIRALYPGTPGGLGTACDADNDCDDNRCITVGIGGSDRSFCSQTCAGSCPNGMVCTDVAGEGNVCVFSNAGIADVGDACGPPGCIDECDGFAIEPGCNICLGSCFAGCNTSNNAGCAAGEQCSPFACDQDANCLSGDCGANGVCNDPVGICIQAGSAVRGQACGGDVGCIDGLACVTDGNGNNGVCLGLCDANGNGCLNTENCLFLFGDATQGACIATGSGEEGDVCNDFDQCGRGLICTGRCEQRCDRGFECLDDNQTCNLIANAGNMRSCAPVGGVAEGEGEEGEGEGGEGEGECDEDRGNFDCAAGFSCDNNECVAGEGPTGTFALCSEDDDCAGGLCSNGVCTRPCDVADGCPSGYSCDEDQGVPGGLCVADSCGQDSTLCEAGFTCEYTSAQRYACAKGAGGVCNCAATPDDSVPTSGLAALGAAAWLLGRRRRLR